MQNIDVVLEPIRAFLQQTGAFLPRRVFLDRMDEMVAQIRAAPAAAGGGAAAQPARRRAAIQGRMPGSYR